MNGKIKPNSKFFEHLKHQLGEKCNHKFPNYKLTSYGDTVFVDYECTECKGIISYSVGKIITPNYDDFFIGFSLSPFEKGSLNDDA